MIKYETNHPPKGSHLVFSAPVLKIPGQAAPEARAIRTPTSPKSSAPPMKHTRCMWDSDATLRICFEMYRHLAATLIWMWDSYIPRNFHQIREHPRNVDDVTWRMLGEWDDLWWEFPDSIIWLLLFLRSLAVLQPFIWFSVANTGGIPENLQLGAMLQQHWESSVHCNSDPISKQPESSYPTLLVVVVTSPEQTFGSFVLPELAQDLGVQVPPPNPLQIFKHWLPNIIAFIRIWDWFDVCVCVAPEKLSTWNWYT